VTLGLDETIGKNYFDDLIFLFASFLSLSFFKL
jgi:hypothetical protein